MKKLYMRLFFCALYSSLNMCMEHGDVLTLRAQLVAAIGTNNFKCFAHIAFARSDVLNAYDMHDGNKITPLHHALRIPIESNRHKKRINEHIHILLQAGADPNASDQYGNTPLHMYRCLSVKRLGLLWYYGAKTNTKNIFGQTPLLVHTRAGNDKIMRWLIESDADLDLQDNYGETALHNACELGFLNMADWLLDKGADFDLMNNDGKKPLDMVSPQEMDYEMFTSYRSKPYRADDLFENNGCYFKRLLAAAIKDVNCLDFMLARSALLWMDDSDYAMLTDLQWHGGVRGSEDKYTTQLFNMVRHYSFDDTKFSKAKKLLMRCFVEEKKRKITDRQRSVRKIVFPDSMWMSCVD